MSDLGWIVVPRWDEFQHYKRRDAPWIKTYVRLLDDDAYLNLTETQRCTLHSIWMAFSKANGRLAADTRKLSGRFNLRVTTLTLEALRDAGFIELAASKPLAARYQDASDQLALTRAGAPSREAEAETEAEEALPLRASASSNRSNQTAPPRAAKRAAPARGTNLTQNGHAATDVLAAYDAAARWLRSDGYQADDWRYRIEIDFGVTDDIELAGLADLQQQLAHAEANA